LVKAGEGRKESGGAQNDKGLHTKSRGTLSKGRGAQEGISSKGLVGHFSSDSEGQQG